MATKKLPAKARPTAPTPKTVDEYIARLSPAAKSRAKELRKIIKEAAPGAEEKISYSIPSFTLHGVLIYYAVWKEHASVYPKSLLMEKAIKELANYEGGKGTVQFPSDKPLPVGLIKKIVKFRVEENMERYKKKKQK